MRGEGRMKIKHIASGSKANAFEITTSITIRIDAGVKHTKPFDTLCITHTHGDHTKYFEQYLKLCNHLSTSIDVFHDLIRKYPHLEKEIDNKYTHDAFSEEYHNQGTTIKHYDMVHDVPCCAFKIIHEEESYLHITDTVEVELHEDFYNCTYYSIEANYNDFMLMTSDISDFLRNRIKDTGHLSNEHTRAILHEITGDKTKVIGIIHMSGDRNNVGLAKVEFEEVDIKGKILFPKGEVYYE
jgi:phosphoribosyl 1,2-cyclic phosphodiesterase